MTLMLPIAVPLVCPVSSAHSLMAPSTWRRLLMQALACEVARALMKLGIAIAANRPMMATTIMISTSVKPALRVGLVVFMFCLFVCGVDDATGGLYNDNFRPLIACCNRVRENPSNRDAKFQCKRLQAFLSTTRLRAKRFAKKMPLQPVPKRDTALKTDNWG